MAELLFSRGVQADTEGSLEKLRVCYLAGRKIQAC